MEKTVASVAWRVTSTTMIYVISARQGARYVGMLIRVTRVRLMGIIRTGMSSVSRVLVVVLTVPMVKRVQPAKLTGSSRTPTTSVLIAR